MSIEQIKQTMIGKWESIATEIRPSISKNADGSAKPFYLKRNFEYLPGDKFQLEIINSADAYGNLLLAKMLIKGNIVWRGAHPIADGAQKVDFIADEGYEVTPLLQGFADVLNQYAGDRFQKWEINKVQNILGKAFAPFGLKDGQIFAEHDLIYIFNNMMFWGARNVDGRGFDTEENRPTNLQIPLMRHK
jgi:hypothetical protein